MTIQGNEKRIDPESMYDGFYGICTNLESDASEIIKLNKQRSQIEDCFRVLKSEFKARPVSLQKDKRMKAHFTTCFLSLLILRILEKRIDEKITTEKLVRTLRSMNFVKLNSDYIPAFKRSKETDMIHDVYDFRRDKEILEKKDLKKLLNQQKK